MTSQVIVLTQWPSDHLQATHSKTGLHAMAQFKTLQLPQGPVQYLEHGQGQPIVFVHGLLVDNKLWQPLVPELGQGVRCILPNWPLGAHSVPMKPDADLSVSGMARLIADFIAELDLHDVILVGNDTGGALAQIVCAQCPERISKMVLTTCDAYDVFPPPAFALLKWLGHVPPLAWLTAQLMHHMPALRRLPFAFGDLTDAPLDGELIEHWLRPMRTEAGVRRDVCKFLRTLSNRYTQDAGVALQHFDKPVLLLWSTRCRHFPKRLAERFQRELSNAELHWIDSTGVFLSLEHAKQMGDKIRPFAAINPVLQPATLPVHQRGTKG
jgi:pimeloyl-ACP methyl ester carboxylesterase